MSHKQQIRTEQKHKSCWQIAGHKPGCCWEKKFVTNRVVEQTYLKCITVSVINTLRNSCQTRFPLSMLSFFVTQLKGDFVQSITCMPYIVNEYKNHFGLGATVHLLFAFICFSLNTLPFCPSPGLHQSHTRERQRNAKRIFPQSPVSWSTVAENREGKKEVSEQDAIIVIHAELIFKSYISLILPSSVPVMKEQGIKQFNNPKQALTFWILVTPYWSRIGSTLLTLFGM